MTRNPDNRTHGKSLFPPVLRVSMAFMLFACVDHINFDLPPPQLRTTIEGMITDGPGPYIVKISEGVDLNADSVVRAPVTKAIVTLFDDEGQHEIFSESSTGDYSTSGLIRGKVGHRYYIRVQTSDGRVFESDPDLLTAVGEIDRIRFEYEARTKEIPQAVVADDVFNVYIDSRGVNDNDPTDDFVRWRFTGTYKVLTYPERHWIWALGYQLPDPYPCSGYRYIGQTYAEPVYPCTCCTCWANNYEAKPQLSDGQLVQENTYKNVKVGEVPISSATFYDKYLVEVEQMSMSRNAFEFFKALRAQKVGASSIFQPPSGEIKGNIHPVNSAAPVVGLFWATAVRSKSIFIQKSDVPYPLPPIAEIRYPCTWYPNSSTTQPANWK